VDVLFLCTGNSCRSILAEATFNDLAPVGWHAMSAGSQPTGQMHPRSLALLEREGIPTEGLSSKSWDNLPETPDIVITVCASAAGRDLEGLAQGAHGEFGRIGCNQVVAGVNVLSPLWANQAIAFASMSRSI
jgi:protein-tyrosine-phosphatase